MAAATEKQLIRLLRGELSGAAAAELEERLDRDPELRGTYRRLRHRWQALQLQDPEPAPPGFADRVVARARGSATPALIPAWWRAAVAGRFATVAIVAGGMVVGLLLAGFWEHDEWAGYLTSEPSLVDSYWAAFEQPDFQTAEEVRP